MLWYGGAGYGWTLESDGRRLILHSEQVERARPPVIYCNNLVERHREGETTRNRAQFKLIGPNDLLSLETSLGVTPVGLLWLTQEGAPC